MLLVGGERSRARRANISLDGLGMTGVERGLSAASCPPCHPELGGTGRGGWEGSRDLAESRGLSWIRESASAHILQPQNGVVIARAAFQTLLVSFLIKSDKG